MPIPLILFVAAASPALALVAALTTRGRPQPAPVRWMLLWCVLLLISDALFLFAAFTVGQNLALLPVLVPASSAAALWALSGWQPNDFLRLTYRLTIVALLVATAVLLFTLRPGPLFDQFLAPLHNLVVLAAALHTLVHRTLIEESPITREDWFWITLGMSLYFAASVAVRPFAQATVATHPDWVRAAYEVRAGITTLAFTLVAWGIAWPTYRRRFGGQS